MENTPGTLQVSSSMKEPSKGEVKDCLCPGQEQVHIPGNRFFEQKSHAEVAVQGDDEKQGNRTTDYVL